MASLPDEHPTDDLKSGSSAQLPTANPTTLMLRRMTLTEPDISRWPWISAPHWPTMVLFEPTLILPAASLPVTLMTRAVVPETALCRAASVETLTAAAEPPPVVVVT